VPQQAEPVADNPFGGILQPAGALSVLADALSTYTMNKQISDKVGVLEIDGKAQSELERQFGKKEAKDLEEALESLATLFNSEAFRVKEKDAQEKAVKIAESFGAEMARGQDAAIAARKAFQDNGVEYGAAFKSACGVAGKGS